MERGDLTQLLDLAAGGDDAARDALLARVYGELRQLARSNMRRESPGHTLQPTALVNEAYLRLFGPDARFANRRHFFGAAAQAMRQILVDQARRKSRLRHGGSQRRLDVDEIDLPIELPVDDLLALDQALSRLEREDPRKAQIVMLRYFVGLEREEVAEVLGISLRTVDRDWRYIVARLQRDLQAESS